jgi:hypothetical protein
MFRNPRPSRTASPSLGDGAATAALLLLFQASPSSAAVPAEAAACAEQGRECADSAGECEELAARCATSQDACRRAGDECGAASEACARASETCEGFADEGGDEGSDEEPGAEFEEAGRPPLALRRSIVLLGPGEKSVTLALAHRRGSSGFEESWDLGFEITLETGFAEGFAAYLRLPVAHRSVKGRGRAGAAMEDTDGPPQGRKERTGLGDLEVGLKYLLLPEGDLLPEVNTSLGLLFPTGAGDYFRNEDLNADPGSGHWAASLGVSLVKAWPPFYLYGGAYHLRYVRSDGLEPGALTGYDLGLSYQATPAFSLGVQYGREYQEETRGGSRRLQGSASSPETLRASFSYGFGSYYLEPYVTFGLNRYATDLDFGLSLTGFF